MAAVKRTELVVTIQNEVGGLAKLMETLSGGGVNVLAFCGYLRGTDEAHILLVPDDPAKAKKVLEAYPVDERTVVAVTTESTKGSGARLTRALADAGVSLDYAYASTTGRGDGTAIFGITDVDKGLRALS